MKRHALLLLALAALSASAGTDCWTYVPGSPRGTISWTDSSGFENVVKGIVLSDGAIRINSNENSNSATLRNLDCSLPVRTQDGEDLAWSPDVFKGNNGYNVVGNSTHLTNIVLPSACTSLGVYCFKSDTALVRVRLNDGLVSIGANAFVGCTALETIDNFLPDSLTSLGDYAFDGCRKLGGDCTANGLVSIPQRAFRYCNALHRLDFGESPLERIGEAAFYENTNLVSVVFPDTVTNIANKAFSGCKNLRSVEPLLPPRLAWFGTDSNSAFTDCPLEGHVVSPSTLERIPTRAFRYSRLETFTGPKKGLKVVGEKAFYDARPFTNVVLSTTLEKIETEWMSNSGTAGVEQHVWFRNLPATLPSTLWTGTKKLNITVHLPWSKQKEWRAWVASAPSGHTFAFDGTAGILPEHRNDVGTWQAGVQQYVTWWKDLDAPTLVLFK